MEKKKIGHGEVVGGRIFGSLGSFIHASHSMGDEPLSTFILSIK
jgi:hypothetical protein